MITDEKQKLLQKKEMLETAYYSGIRQITFEGETIIYQTLSEMKQVISDLELKLKETNKKRIVRLFPSR